MKFIMQICVYAKAIRILAKGYLSITLIPHLRIKGILDKVKTAIQKSSPDYDVVIKRLHPYYDMKLVTFGIDKDKNLIVQCPVFIQPYTQQLLILYQLETVPVAIIHQNRKADSYTH